MGERVAIVYKWKPNTSPRIFWGHMYQGGEIALQATCDGFDSHCLHQIFLYCRQLLHRLNKLGFVLVQIQHVNCCFYQEFFLDIYILKSYHEARLKLCLLSTGCVVCCNRQHPKIDGTRRYPVRRREKKYVFHQCLIWFVIENNHLVKQESWVDLIKMTRKFLEGWQSGNVLDC